MLIGEMIRPSVFIPRHIKNPIDTYYFNKFYSKQSTFTIKDKIEIIRKAVKKVTGYDPYDNPSYRKRELVESRQLFMVFVRKFIKDVRGNQMTQADTAALLGKEHATVITAMKTVNNLCDTDLQFKKTYDAIETRIKSAFN